MLTNDYIRKRLEWICKNFLKVLDCENGTSCIGVVSNAEKMNMRKGMLHQVRKEECLAESAQKVLHGEECLKKGALSIWSGTSVSTRFS